MLTLKFYDLKRLTILISLLYVILIIIGFIQSVYEMILEEFDFEFKSGLVFFLHLSIHLFLVITLGFGALKEKPIYLLPWLIAAFITFVIGTYYSTIYRAANDLWLDIINFVSLACCWMMWFIVFLFGRRCRFKKFGKIRLKTSNSVHKTRTKQETEIYL